MVVMWIADGISLGCPSSLVHSHASISWADRLMRPAGAVIWR